MTALNQYLDRIRQNNITLREINLRNENLGDKDVKQLLAALKDSSIADRIHSIHLAGNSITEFDASDVGLTNLQVLSLAKNQLKTFNPKGLESLHTLGLSGNQLTAFSGKGLERLHTLGLSGNQLTAFSGEGLGRLVYLFLDRNQLTTFNGHGLWSIQELHLNFNRLTDFNGKGLGTLQQLSLSHNQLTSINVQGLERLRRTLAILNNPLTQVCKIMLEAMRIKLNLRYLQYDAPEAQANQQLTNELMTEHFMALTGPAQTQLARRKEWLSMVRRFGLPDEREIGLPDEREIGLPDELIRLVFECVYEVDYITKELETIKAILPEQAENVRRFEESEVFARIKAQYDLYVKSLYEGSFKDARGMQTLLSSYRQHRDTPDFRYLQDNTRIDPRNNPFQLALRN